MIEKAFAATGNISIDIPKPSIQVVENIGPLISGLISVVLAIAVLLAFIWLIWGGIEWITSGGDKTHTETARTRISNAVLGLFIVFAAWAVMKIISQFLGFEFPNLKFQTGY